MSENERTDARTLLAIVFLLLSIGVILTFAGGCSRAGGVETLGSWSYIRTTAEDVTRVHTVDGSIWGDVAHLEEEASIGAAEGPDEYLLGDIRGIEAWKDRIYVLDGNIPVVRVYDRDGTHLKDIGREGDGPGEFRRPQSLSVDPTDGTLYVRSRGRIEVFTSEGDPIDRRLISGTFSTSRPMVLTDDGRIYTMQLMNPGSDVTEWEMGMVHYAPEGAQNDTILAPVFDFEPWVVVGRSENNTSSNDVPYGPDIFWALSTDRSMIGGVSDEFSFRVIRPDGRTTEISTDFEPVPVPRDEARWQEKIVTQNMQEQFPGWAWNGPAVPDHKPAYISLIPDRSGRVWVRVPGPSRRLEDCAEDSENTMDYFRNPCWTQSTRWLVFQETGEYLGEVAVPEHASISQAGYIKGDDVIVRMQDEEGVPYVKRYRLVTP